MILETGQSAWEERIRLMDKAEKRIVLTTFDMREGQSTEDVLSVILHKADEGVSVKILIDGISGFLRMERQAHFLCNVAHPSKCGNKNL
ncbi:MAG: phospholipase D-like domain-containing protein [Frisingicoccus sp.]